MDNILDFIKENANPDDNLERARLILTLTDEGDGLRTELCIQGNMTERIFHVGVGIANQISEHTDEFLHHAVTNIDENLKESPFETELMSDPENNLEGDKNDPEA